MRVRMRQYESKDLMTTNKREKKAMNEEQRVGTSSVTWIKSLASDSMVFLLPFNFFKLLDWAAIRACLSSLSLDSSHFGIHC